MGLYANIELSRITGIDHAKYMGLDLKGLMEDLVMLYLHRGSIIFIPRRRRGLFTVMRHPIRRGAVN